MPQTGQTDFCSNCRKQTEYELRKEAEKETIRDRLYEFTYTKAYCRECGEEMGPLGLIDYNSRERDIQYRRAEQIITVEEIQKLMQLYHIGKAPLSLALGFGEVTVASYMEGQMPSKAYSDLMKEALSNPCCMERLLDENRAKVGEAAYKKARRAAADLKSLFQVSDRMLMVIARIFEQMQEVTPLVLQKMLYYIQGIYSAVYQRPLFEENCVAWQHGPVYEKVYTLFRDFKYNPIDDDRFVLFEGREKYLADDERQIVDLVAETFGCYGGKVLEAITHTERPWQEARKGYGADDPARVVIPKEEIAAYFREVSKAFDIRTKEGLRNYIQSRLAYAYG